MALSVKITKKELRFSGDRERHNVVVSGPAEIFDRAFKRFLFLHGLNYTGHKENHAIWSGRPAIGAPPLYLAALLAHTRRARMNRDTREMLAQATSERERDDDLRHIFSPDKALTAGAQALMVRAGSQDFLANCDADNTARIMLLEGAGWIPLPRVTDRIAMAFGTRPYFTRDPFIAANLEPFMDEKARQALSRNMRRAQEMIALSKSQEAPVGFDIPSPDGVDYLPFQKGGIARVSESGQSAIIADEMGLGKTIQGIGIVNARPGIRNVLVFCQANMRLKWVREIEKWKTDPDLTVSHAEGSKWPDTNIVVINYDIAPRHLAQIHDRQWDIVIADEAHNLKNENAVRTKAILGDLMTDDNSDMVPLAPGGQLVHLTGTPKPNRVSELWPLLTSTRPDLWGQGPEARQIFINRYEPPKLVKRKFQKNGREFERIIPLPGDPRHELELQLRLRGSGSFIRRLKRETDLPPKFRTPIEMPMRLSAQDKAALREAEADLADIIARANDHEPLPGQSREAGFLIDVIGRLSPDSPEFQEIARVRRNLGIIKAPLAARFILDELMQDKHLDPENQRKTVVFAHHKDVISTIAELAEAQIPGGVLVYDGSLSHKKRQAHIDRFHEDPQARLFIMSLAGATGITLTASHRMRVVEPDWSPSNMVQIEDRIWRIGQEKSCDIGYLFVPESLDTKMGLALIAKMETDERTINTLGFRGMKDEPVRSASSEPMLPGVA